MEYGDGALGVGDVCGESTVGAGDVDKPVTVEVGEAYSPGVESDGITDRGGEPASTEIADHRDLFVVVVRDHDVQSAVAVHIPDRQTVGCIAGGDDHPGSEGAVPIVL